MNISKSLWSESGAKRCAYFCANFVCAEFFDIHQYKRSSKYSQKCMLWKIHLIFLHQNILFSFIFPTFCKLPYIIHILQVYVVCLFCYLLLCEIFRVAVFFTLLLRPENTCCISICAAKGLKITIHDFGACRVAAIGKSLPVCSCWWHLLFVQLLTVAALLSLSLFFSFWKQRSISLFLSFIVELWYLELHSE